MFSSVRSSSFITSKLVSMEIIETPRLDARHCICSAAGFVVSSLKEVRPLFVLVCLELEVGGIAILKCGCSCSDKVGVAMASGLNVTAMDRLAEQAPVIIAVSLVRINMRVVPGQA